MVDSQLYTNLISLMLLLLHGRADGSFATWITLKGHHRCTATWHCLDWFSHNPSLGMHCSMGVQCRDLVHSKAVEHRNDPIHGRSLGKSGNQEADPQNEEIRWQPCYYGHCAHCSIVVSRSVCLKVWCSASLMRRHKSINMEWSSLV